MRRGAAARRSGQRRAPRRRARQREPGPVFVAAVSVFVFRRGRMLALRRSVRRDAAPGAWDAVSGRVLPGEHPLETARRETREETGLRIAIDPRPITAYQAKRAAAPMVVIAYRARARPGRVRISPEHDEWAWMSVAEFGRACRFPALVAAAKRASALWTMSAAR